jgi:AcrR family transcriptional regulator
MPERPSPVDTVSTAGSRAAAKLETRAALIRAAREAFAEEGLEGPSLDAICERAGFTRGAFYVHFESRDDLVAAVMEDTLGAVVDGVIGSGEGEDDLAATVRRYVELSRAMTRDEALRERAIRFHQLLDACWRAPALRRRLLAMLEGARKRLEAAVRAAREAGRARPDLPPAETATLLLLLALGVIVGDELGLPLALDPTRDALLALLVGPARPG